MTCHIEHSRDVGVPLAKPRVGLSAVVLARKASLRATCFYPSRGMQCCSDSRQ